MKERFWWRGIEDQISKKYEPIRLIKFSNSLEKSLEFIHKMDKAENYSDINLVLRVFCEFFGINRSGWLSTAVNRYDSEVLFSYNCDNIISEYTERNINDIDIMHHLARSGVSPIPWGLAHHEKYICQEEKKLFSFYRENGCGRGIMFPIRGLNRNLVGGFNFCISKKEFLEIIPEFLPISHFFCCSLNQSVVKILKKTKLIHHVNFLP